MAALRVRHGHHAPERHSTHKCHAIGIYEGNVGATQGDGGGESTPPPLKRWATQARMSERCPDLRPLIGIATLRVAMPTRRPREVYLEQGLDYPTVRAMDYQSDTKHMSRRPRIDDNRLGLPDCETAVNGAGMCFRF